MDSKDSSNSAIFSLRIVSVDNYMKTPLFGLDTCYSDFRADEVKQVSVTCYYNCILMNLCFFAQITNEFWFQFGLD